MKYRRIEGLPNPVPLLICGTFVKTMRQGGDAGDALDAAFDGGITAFDTAAAYDESEVSLGRWMKSRGNRDALTVITKGCNWEDGKPRLSRAIIRAELENSLRRLQTDVIDVYLLHRDDPSVPVGEVAETLGDEVKRGRVRLFGVSNWTPERIRAFNAYAAERRMACISVFSPSFSLADCVGDPWGGSVTISGKANEGARAWLAQSGMPVFAYSGLARGFLSGKVKSDDEASAPEIIGEYACEEYAYPENFARLRRAEELARQKGATVSQIALAWLLSQPLKVHAVTAASKSHLADNLKALQTPLTREELCWLHDGPDASNRKDDKTDGTL